MTQEARAERTVRLLTLRLEELATAVERARTPSAEVERLLELAAMATAHAVALELLTSDRAARVWREAEERHPALETVEIRRPDVPERAAA